MSIEKLASKYMASVEHVFDQIKVADTSPNFDLNSVRNVVNSARAYLDDAKYYKKQKKFEVSLASAAYCEGLLDALKMLGVVKFEWSVRKKGKKEK